MSTYAQEVESDKRHDYVEMKVIDYMREGGEYYPFTSENVTEALSELAFADQALLAAYLQKCNDKPEYFENHTFLADFMVDRVHDYWHSCAVKKAQEDYDKAGF